VAAKEINDSGGILGREIELVYEDDEGSPAKEPAVMRKLLDGGCQFILGSVGSSQVLSELSVTTPAKILQAGVIFAEEGADAKRFPYHYQFNYNTGHQGEAWTRMALETLKLRKIGILSENSSFGAAGARAMTAALQKRGVTPTGAEVYPTTSMDLKPYLSNLQRAGTEVILLLSAPAQGALLTFRALQSMKWSLPILGGNGLFYDTLLQNVPEEQLKDAYATYLKTFTYTASQPPAARQVEYAKKLIADPETKGGLLNAAACPMYDFLHVLKVIADAEKTLESDRLKAAFDSVKNYPGIIGPVSFTPENHCALTANDLAMFRVLSGKNSQANGCFRERVDA